MAGILNIPFPKTVKALYLGESGSWKTGSLASLVTEGYKLRILDIDKGTKILLSLLTDPRYPYADLIQKRKIDLNDAVDAVPLDMDIGLKTIKIPDPKNPKSGQTIESHIYAPLSTKAWTKAGDMLIHWNDGQDRGRLVDWDDKTILVIDTFAKLSYGAYYFNQAINSRLGNLDSGNNWRQDIGGSHNQLRRLLQMFYDSRIKCNILVITHVSGIDDSRGFIESPGQVAFEQRKPNVKGFPMSIGRAMAKEIGTYFNDLYIAKEEYGRSSIFTVATDEISAKRSVWLDREYPSSTGLAEIFAAHRGEPPPNELIEAVRGSPKSPEKIPSTDSPSPSSNGGLQKPKPLH